MNKNSTRLYPFWLKVVATTIAVIVAIWLVNAFPHATRAAYVKQLVGRAVAFPVKIEQNGKPHWAIYMIEDGELKKVHTLDVAFLHEHPAHIQVLLSPDRSKIGILYERDESATTVLAKIDLDHPEKQVIIQERERSTCKGCRTKPETTLTSFVWQDDSHVIYAETNFVTTVEADPYAFTPVSGALWRADVNSLEVTQIATGQIYRIERLSDDGNNAFITRRLPLNGFAIQGYTGFGKIDLRNGEAIYAFPTDDELNTFKTTPRLYGSPYFLRDSQGNLFMRLFAPSSGSRLAQDINLNTLDVVRTHVYDDFVTDRYWDPLVEMLNVDNQSLPDIMQEISRAQKAQFDARFDEWPIPLYSVYTNDEDIFYLNNSGSLRLKDQTGKVIHEWQLPTSKIAAVNSSSTLPNSTSNQTAVANAVVNWSVPYMHQLKDTAIPDPVNNPSNPATPFSGYGACGPTSSVMGLAYFHKIKADPVWVSSYSRYSDYGKYVSQPYTVAAACQGVSIFNNAVVDFAGNVSFRGAHGEMYDPCCGSALAKIESFVKEHDLGTYKEFYPSLSKVKAELDGGGIVILGWTYGQKQAPPPNNTLNGHIIVVRGYTSDDKLIVNDPAGYVQCSSTGNGTVDYNQNGAERLYSWADLSCRAVNWYLAIYGSHYLTNVRYDTIAESSIAIQNSYGAYGANVDVCLMDPSGTKNAGSKSVWIPANGRYSFGSSDLPWGFAGSAVIRPNQTGVGSVLLNSNPWKIYDYASTRSELATNESYIPWYACNFSSWNSTLTVQNANTLSGSNAVTAYHYNQWGSLITQQTITLSPWQQNTLSLCSGGGYYGSVKLVGESGKPIVASVAHQHPTVDSIAYEGVSSPGSNAHAPSLVKNFANGYQSSLNFQSLASSSVYIDYYGAAQYWKSVSVNGSTVAYLPDEPIQAYAWSGAASMSTAGPMAVAEHFASPNGGALGYPLVSMTYPRLIMPRIRTDRAMSKDASVTILNPSYGSVAVTVYLYWANGAFAGSYNLPIQPRSTVSLYYEIPNTFDGLGVITGVDGARVAAVVHESDGSSKSVGYQALPLGNMIP